MVAVFFAGHRRIDYAFVGKAKITSSLFFLTNMVLPSEFVVVEHFASPEYVILDLLLNSPKLYLPSCGTMVSVWAELKTEISKKRIHVIC